MSLAHSTLEHENSVWAPHFTLDKQTVEMIIIEENCQNDAVFEGLTLPWTS